MTRPLLLLLLCACDRPAETPPPEPPTTPEPVAAETETPPEPTAPECGDADACLAKAAELDASDPAAATEAFYGACLGGSVEGCEQAGLRWSKTVEATGDDPLNDRIMDAYSRSCELGNKFVCRRVEQWDAGKVELGVLPQ